jgi:uracil-DNA glycosylase
MQAPDGGQRLRRAGSGGLSEAPPNDAWWRVLEAQGVADDLAQLDARLCAARAAGKAIAPAGGNVYRALNLTPPEAVRAVILGQDPYPTPGHADGLCFSVRPGVAPPRSLRNIFRELADDLYMSPPAHGHLEAWAKGGVLMLNTVLTVEEGRASAHAGWGWQRVTDAVIAGVAQARDPVAFLLWGRHAQAKAALIGPRHLVLAAPHPSPLSARRGFFGSRPFSRANAFLAAAGRPPIDWRLPPA